MKTLRENELLAELAQCARTATLLSAALQKELGVDRQQAHDVIYSALIWDTCPFDTVFESSQETLPGKLPTDTLH